MSILNGIELFASLSNTERDTLALFCQERLVYSGEMLFSEGDEAIALYVVKTGSIKVFRDRSDGEKILGYIDDNGLVGEMALFDPEAPKKRMASARAIDDTMLLVIMDYAILELSKKHKEVYNKIANIMLERKKDNERKKI